MGLHSGEETRGQAFRRLRHLRRAGFALLFGKADSLEAYMRRTRLSSKSQVTLPADYRRRLGVEPGEELLMDFQEDRIVLLKNTGSALDELQALPPELWAGAADEIQRARDEWDR
jgi:AbrB family looped-hinge helix DNA binding protein